MPIDPQIPLSVQMPQQQQFNPMQSIGALMQMKNVASEVALRDAQVEQARQHSLDMKAQTDQRNADLKDQNTLQEMMANPEISTKIGAGDLTPFYGKVQQKTLDALETNVQNHHKELATSTKTDLENRGAALGEITNGVTGLLGFGDDIGKVNAALPGLKQQLMDSGTFKLAKVDPAKVPDSVASVDELQRWVASVGLASAANAKVLAQKKEQTGIDKEVAGIDQSKAAAADSAAQAAIRNRQLQGMSPDGLLPEEQVRNTQAQATAAQAAAREAETIRHNRVDERMAGGRLAVEQQRLQQSTGGVQLNATQQAIAQKLADGDFNPAQLTRFPDKEALISGAIALNPNWSATTYLTKRAFEDPQAKQSQNLGTISRIVGHIGQFEKNSKDMGFAPAYAVGAKITGGQAALNNDAHAISAELEKLVSGGVGTEGQVRQWEAGLHSPSAAARQQSIDEISQLIGSQYEGMNQTYKTTIGRDLPIEKYVSSQGQEWMKAKGINVGGAAAGAQAAPKIIRARDTGGNLHEAPAGTALPPGWKLE